LRISSGVPKVCPPLWRRGPGDRRWCERTSRPSTPISIAQAPAGPTLARPFWRIQLAHVWRRSCQRKFSNSNSLKASVHARVFLRLRGLPALVGRPSRSKAKTSLEDRRFNRWVLYSFNVCDFGLPIWR